MVVVGISPFKVCLSKPMIQILRKQYRFYTLGGKTLTKNKAVAGKTHNWIENSSRPFDIVPPREIFRVLKVGGRNC